MVEYTARSQVYKLTVGQLREKLAELPDDAPIELSLDCEYDGEPTQRSGPAQAACAFDGKLHIDGTALVHD